MVWAAKNPVFALLRTWMKPRSWQKSSHGRIIRVKELPHIKKGRYTPVSFHNMLIRISHLPDFLHQFEVKLLDLFLFDELWKSKLMGFRSCCNIDFVGKTVHLSKNHLDFNDLRIG